MDLQKDIFGSLALNRDQAAFVGDITTLWPKIATFGKRDGTPGYAYRDFVITVRASHDRRSFTVVRNRTGKLLLAVENGKVVSINWEYTFVEEHVKKLLKEAE